MMFKIVLYLLIIVVTVNSLSYVDGSTDFYKILGHGLFMPLCGAIYFIKRNWQFGQVDKLIFAACLLGSVCDVVIFFNLDEKGEFLQLVSSFFVHLIFIVVFRREGAFVFNIEKTRILKVIIPALLTFFFFGFVLLKTLPVLLYFTAIFYTVEVTILMVLGFFRPASDKEYWFVAIGVSVLLLKDFMYSYFFYIYKGTHPLLYIPLYLANALCYFLIIYGVALNQNSKNTNYEKISIKAILKSLKGVFISDTPKVKRRIYESLSVTDTKYV